MNKEVEDNDNVSKDKGPNIIDDIDFALYTMMWESINAGDIIDREYFQNVGLALYLGLRELPIYDQHGEKNRPYRIMSAEATNIILDFAIFICPLCKADIGVNGDCLYNHLLYCYPANHVGSPPEASAPVSLSFEYIISDSWIKQFLKRHDMVNVLWSTTVCANRASLFHLEAAVPDILQAREMGLQGPGYPWKDVIPNLLNQRTARSLLEGSGSNHMQSLWWLLTLSEFSSS